MAAIRYNSTFYSKYGTEWKIEIYDKDSSVGSPTSFNTYGDGFSLSYEGTDAESYTPVIGSAVKIFFAVEDAAAQTLISDILTSQEKRFYIMIYKASSFYWGGVLLQDLGTQLDESLPSQITLSAVDGIGYLKDFSYGYPQYAPDTETPPALYKNRGYQDCLGHLSNIFAGMFALLDGSPYPNNNNLLSTAVTFYENNMHSGTPATTLDPLAVTRINHNSFIKLAEDINKFDEAITYYEVLEQICLIFNARFFLSDGKWRLYNINQYEDTSFPERTYNFVVSYNTNPISRPASFTGEPSFVFASSSALSINKTIDQDTYATLATPSRTFYPNMVYSKRKFLKEGSTNLLPQQDNFEPNSNNEYYNNVISIDSSGSSDYKINLSGHGYVNINNAGAVGEINATFLLKGLFWISDNAGGRKYFRNTIADPEDTDWNTTAGPFYIRCQPVDIITNFQQQPFSFNFTSDNINIDIESYYFWLDGFGFWTGAGNSAYANGYANFGGGQITTLYFLNYIEANILFEGVVQPDPVETDYYAWNPNAFLNEKKLKITDSLIGDDTAPNSYGKLQIKNTSGAWVDSALWKVGGAGDAEKIINLQLQEITKLRLEPVPKLSVQIKGDIDFFNRVVYDSIGWIPLGMTINAGSGIIDFQLFKVAEISGTITLKENDKNQLPKPPTTIANSLKLANQKLFKLKDEAITYNATTANNTITEIFIDGVTDKRFNLHRNQVANVKVYTVGVITTGSNKGDCIAVETFGCMANIDGTLKKVGTNTETEKKDSGIGGSVGVALDIDNTNKTIKLTVIGEASDTVVWKSVIDSSIVTFEDPLNLIYEDDNNIITEASDNLTTENF